MTNERKRKTGVPQNRTLTFFIHKGKGTSYQTRDMGGEALMSFKMKVSKKMVMIK